MTAQLRISVVVSTYNRAAGLRATLEGLRHQVHEDFEVVVVNGPSTDDTVDVLAEYADRIRTGTCAEQSLTRSRNVGIALASGEVVAFIDDDAVPEPAWLAELVAAYDDAAVGGAGGIVYDHTGMRLQYRYSVCSRVGEPRWDVEPPLDAFVAPRSEPFLYLQGTNQSYRRRRLVEIGGFNERLDHYFDDSEISMQMIDAGHPLRALPNAGVHHKYMASSVRNRERVLTDPYRIIKDRFAFAFLACEPRTHPRVTATLVEWAETMRAAGRSQRDAGQLTPEQFAHYDRRVDEAVAAALDDPRRLERPRCALPDADPAAFRRYPTVRADGRRLTICLLTKDYPPGEVGGVGRLTEDFAREFAPRGHEVHVVTVSHDIGRVDFEDGVWVHRLESGGPLVPELADLPIGPNLALLRTMYGEVCRIHERGAVDVVVGALWLAQGLLCELDPRFATVLLLESGTRTIMDFHPSWERVPSVQQLVALEGSVFRHARHLHAISRDILATVQRQYGPTEVPAFVIPLGRRDQRAAVGRARPPEAPIRILFVSRLERRKGVDVLLPVAARLVRSYPNVEVVLAGTDTENTELGETYTAAFRREFGDDATVTSRVRFTGWLSEEALAQAYADADVFCLPARYESLGLVVIEAMGFGLPVVTSEVGGLAEIVESGVSGVLVPVADPSALEAALRRLIDDPALRRRLGDGARDAFEERFTLARTVPHTLDALREVVARDAERRRAGAIDRLVARDAVARALPAIVAEVAGVDAARAEAIATALLDESWHTRHVLQAMTDLWSSSDDAFVTALYPLLLGRQADAPGVRHWRTLLDSGYTRLDVVRALVTCDEAVARKTDASWLPALADAMEVRTNGVAPVRRTSARARAFVKKLPAYLSNAAYLPTNVRELRAEAAGTRAAQDRLERVLREHALRQARLEEQQGRLEETVSSRLLPGIDDARAGSAVVLERQEAAARTHDAQAAALRQEMVEQGAAVQRVAAQVDRGLTAVSDWVSLLQRKVEMLALDLREQVSTRREPMALPEPRAVDSERLRRKLAAMGAAVRVNLGCGERPLDAYVNVDFREAPHVDIVADARRLPFEDESLAEIASSHLVEHFRRHELATVVLPYWRRLLRAGGTLRTVCPNWQEMLRRVQTGEMSLDAFTTVTFGAQDYFGDDHFAMYTPQTLREVLAATGFGSIEVVVESRQNGLCPEMEIVARKSGGGS